VLVLARPAPSVESFFHMLTLTQNKSLLFAHAAREKEGGGDVLMDANSQMDKEWWRLNPDQKLYLYNIYTYIYNIFIIYI